jgi:apolipoprotein N-acyltransferase
MPQAMSPVGPRGRWNSLAITVIAALCAAASTGWPAQIIFDAGKSSPALQLVALTLLSNLLESRVAAKRDGFKLGLLFATIWLAGTFWWLYIAMHTYGGLPGPVALASVVALAAALALYYATACALYVFLKPSGVVAGAMLFASLWTAAELARGTWLTGFGWGAIGYAHVDGGLSVLAPWVGAYGITLVAAFIPMLIVRLWAANRRPVAVMLMAVVGALALAPSPNFTRPNGSLSVTLLQGNIAQDQKFETASGIPAALDWYQSKMITATTDLVVAPETAIPLLPQDLPPGYLEKLDQHFRTGNTALLTGIPLGSYGNGYTNSVIGQRPGREDLAHAWRYDKHHLVPFGEFIPGFFKWFTQLMRIPLGDFNRGPTGQPSMEWREQRLAPNICYEDLFGEELGTRFIDENLAPTVFVNVSNLGWFDDSVAIDQHLQISRMRALEFQRPFIRATNTGATAIIDHQGNVTQVLPRLQQDVLIGDIEGRTGITPFAWWIARCGLWPYWILIVGVVLQAWHSKRRLTRL